MGSPGRRRAFRRYQRLLSRGKRPQETAVTAVARELLGFVWAMARRCRLGEELARGSHQREEQNQEKPRRAGSTEARDVRHARRGTLSGWGSDDIVERPRLDRGSPDATVHCGNQPANTRVINRRKPAGVSLSPRCFPRTTMQ